MIVLKKRKRKTIQIKSTNAVEQEPKVIVEKEIIKEETSALKKYGIPALTFVFGSLLGGLGTYYLKENY